MTHVRCCAASAPSQLKRPVVDNPSVPASVEVREAVDRLVSEATWARPEDALTAIEEAAETHRELARARPDVFRPDLATSLNNLSNRLGGLGRPEDALTAIEEAVTIRWAGCQVARCPLPRAATVPASCCLAEHGEDLSDSDASPREPKQ